MLKNYVSSKNLFPNWDLAENLLVSFIQGIDSTWQIDFNKFNSGVEISLSFPYTKDELSGERVLMWLTFPGVYSQKVQEICRKVMLERIPDLSEYKHTPICDIILDYMKSDIIIKEQQIIAEGGRCLKEEFAFKLGVYFAYLVVKGKDEKDENIEIF